MLWAYPSLPKGQSHLPQLTHLRVIPSVMAGSAIAGALSMAFGIGLRAPHGGIFVVPLVENGALLYALAILVGSVVSALLIGFLKKPVK